MNGLDYLNLQLNMYYELRNNIEQIVIKISSSIDSIELAAATFKNYYTLDSKSADNMEIINNKEKLLEEKDALFINIIPAINREIQRISNEIESIIAAMMAEAAAAETAAAAGTKG